jgi:UPF0271 protein
MTRVIDLNCDMGESFGPWKLGADEAIMPFISSANIACGYHAGDPHVMRKTVALAASRGVAIGAHPALPDLVGFGRRQMAVTPEELKDYLYYQIGALREFCRTAGVELQHVKPHGALYHMGDHDDAIAQAIGEAVQASGEHMILIAPAGGNFEAHCRKMGCRVASEGFADRAYNRDGSLVPRTHPRALMTDPAEGAAQALQIARTGRVTTVDGTELALEVDTICCHGDTPGALAIVRAVRERLDKAGVAVRPLGSWLSR